MMTRRDFEAIAEVMRDHFFDRPGYLLLLEDLANAFKRSNERFDKERFILACTPKSYRTDNAAK